PADGQCRVGAIRGAAQAVAAMAIAPAPTRTNRQERRMTALDIRAILEHLPHRYPMLLVDRVIELEKGKRIVAIKNVSINEPFFTGHFPYLPVMPGVLQVEALAQAAGILSFQTMGRVSDASTVYYFVGIDS